ncbi:MAG: carboxypeptidase regulatory-like domain-containing protein [Deltaproteobacteria bacterium]|nr:carboxypeptidase regulatory-like domain-containing protein [Deltaproteobacteria bacterium]
MMRWLVPVLVTGLWVVLALTSSDRRKDQDAPAGHIEIWGWVEAANGVQAREPVELALYSEQGGEGRLRARTQILPGTVFRFPGLEPGIHHILASSAGLAATTTTTVRGRGRAGPYIIALERSSGLAGRVTSRTGARPGARVRLLPEPAAGDPTKQSPWRPPLEMTADGSGRFAASGLAPGAYRVEVASEGHAGTTMSRVQVPGPELEIRLVELGRLLVRVVQKVDEVNGFTVAGAQVRLNGGRSGTVHEGITTRGGIAVFERLVPGTYSIDAVKGQLLAYRQVDVTVAEGEEARATIDIKPGLALEGMIQDGSTMAPVDGACVVVSSRSDTPRLSCSTSDVKGRFRVAGLTPGTYAVVVQAAGFLRRRLPLIRIGAETAAAAQVTLERSMRITGTVTDSSGLPVSGARVFVDEASKLSSSLFEGFLDIHLPALVPEGPGILAVGELGVTLGPVPPIPIDELPTGLTGTPGSGQQAMLPQGCGCLEELGGGQGRGGRTGPDGSFLVDGIAPGEVSLVVVHPAHATLRSQPITLEAGEEPPPVNLVLATGSTLGGRVLDPEGVPVDGALVWIEGPSTFLAQPIVVGPDGTYRAEHVAGEVKVSASSPGTFSASRIVTMAEGTSSLEVNLVLEPEGERVPARVLGPWSYPVESALVTVTSGSGPTAMVRAVRSDADGMVSFPALPGPEWVIKVSHDSYRTLRSVHDPWGPYDEPALMLGFAAGVSGTVMNGWSHTPMEEFTVTVIKDGLKVMRASFKGGGFTLTDLPPGPCILRLEAEIFEVLTTEVTLPEGTGPADVTLPGLELWMEPLDPGA